MSRKHITELCLPRLGETMEQGRVTRWLVSPGDRYERGDILLEVETDKTIVEVPALEAGRLVEVLVAQDDSVTIDAAIARVEVQGASVEALEVARKIDTVADSNDDTDAGPVNDTVRYPRSVTSSNRAFVSPRARRRARQQGIDLRSLRGTGRRGRVQEADVLQARHKAGRQTVSRAAGINVTDRFLEAGNARLFHRRWDPGEVRNTDPLVVLVHGLFGDVDSWAETGLALARDGLSTVALDLPAHGQSQAGDSTLQGQVSALRSVLQHHDRPIVLVGHSFGGSVASELAASLGEQLQALVLIAPVGLGSRIEQGFIDSLTRAPSPVVLKRELARLTVKALLPGSGYLQTLEAQLIAQSEALQSLCAEISIAGVQRLDIRSSLSSLSCPVSVLWGREDMILSWTDALNAPVGSALYLLPQVGHMPMWEASAVVQQVVARATQTQGSR